ncbi:MAG TPA: hypothetical protein VFK05_30710 [Polyangiaceae bacterium]|nr:hypothetical protein [Polyangiaceae bacterium]
MRAPSVALIALLVTASGAVQAAPRRRHFEPDDLELEQPGILDFDVQAGPVLGNSYMGDHLLIPDFEIALGLTRNVEIDVMGSLTIYRQNGKRGITGDSLWLASKLGLFDTRDGHGNAWALGLELGPRLPTFDAVGIGYGALGLLGFKHRGLSLVLNTGSFLDPGASLAEKGPHSLLLGLDVNAELDPRALWSLQSELAFAHYLGPDPDELTFSFGATYAVSPHLDLSVTALAGFFPQTDHFALLVGASPQVGLW